MSELEKLLLKPTEAAEALGIGRTMIYEMLQQGLLPTVRFGRSIRVPVRALEEWIKNHQNGGGVSGQEVQQNGEKGMAN